MIFDTCHNIYFNVVTREWVQIPKERRDGKEPTKLLDCKKNNVFPPCNYMCLNYIHKRLSNLKFIKSIITSKYWVLIRIFD